MKYMLKKKINQIMAFFLAVVLTLYSMPITSIALEGESQKDDSEQTGVLIYGGEQWRTLFDDGKLLSPDLFGVEIDQPQEETTQTPETESGESTESSEESESTEESDPGESTESSEESESTEEPDPGESTESSEESESTEEPDPGESTESSEESESTEEPDPGESTESSEESESTEEPDPGESTESSEESESTEESESGESTESGKESESGEGSESTEESESDESTESSDESQSDEESNSDNEDDGESKPNDPPSTNTEDKYSYFVSQGEDLVTLTDSENGTVLKVNEGKTGCAVIGIQKNGGIIEGKAYKLTVQWADLPEGIGFSDASGPISSDDGTEMEAKNFLRIQAPTGWKVSKTIGAWQDEVSFEEEGDREAVVYFCNEKDEVAKWEKVIRFSKDVDGPQVTEFTIDGITAPNEDTLFIYGSGDKAIITCQIGIVDSNFTLGDFEHNYQNSIKFYFDELDDKALRITYGCQAQNPNMYSFTVELPMDDYLAHQLKVKVMDTYGNSTTVPLENYKFQYNPLEIKYLSLEDNANILPFEQDEQCFQTAPTIHFEFNQLNFDKDNVKVHMEHVSPKGQEISSDISLDENGYQCDQQSYWIDSEISYGDGKYQVTFFYYDRDKGTVSKTICYVVDGSGPQLEVQYVIPEGKGNPEGAYEKDQYIYAQEAEVIFTITEEHFDPNRTEITLIKNGQREKLENIEWENVSENPKVKSFTYLLTSDQEGQFSFDVTGMDSVGNPLNWIKGSNDLGPWDDNDFHHFKGIVIDATKPDMNSCFFAKGRWYQWGGMWFFDEKVNVVMKASDARSPIYMIEYCFKPEGESEVIKKIDEFDDISDSGYIKAVEFPELELDENNQPKGKFWVRTCDWAGNWSDILESGTITWDSIAPVLSVKSECTYNVVAEDRTAYALGEVTSDSLSFEIVEKDFDYCQFFVTIDGKEIQLKDAADAEVEELEAAGDEDSDVTMGEEEKSYIIRKVEGKEDTWILEGVEISGEGAHSIRVSYRDSVSHNITAMENDGLAEVCLNGRIVFDVTNPELTVTPKTEVVKTEENVSYFACREVTFLVNVADVSCDHDSLEVCFSDSDGSDMLPQDKPEWELKWLENGTCEITVKCPEDTYYRMDVSCKDMSENGGSAHTEFVVDASAPEELSYTFSDPVSKREGVRYYDDKVEVTLTAKDTTTGVKKFYYWLQDKEGNLIGEKYEITALNNPDGTASASFELPLDIDGQLDGEFHFSAENGVNLAREYKPQGAKIVVDRTAPVFSYSFGDSSMQIWNNKLYFNESVNLIITVKEAHFYEKDFSVMTDGLTLPEIEWMPVDGNLDTWQGVIKLEDGHEYNLQLGYHDRSGHNMVLGESLEYGEISEGKYTFWPIVIDAKQPLIQIDIEEDSAWSDDVADYYDRDVNCVIVITENHFSPEFVDIKVTAEDIDGNPVDYNERGSEEDRYKALLKRPESWSHEEGTNDYVARLTFDTEARYTIRVECQDPSNNENKKAFPADKAFVVDKTAPTDLKIQYSEPVNQKEDAIREGNENKPGKTSYYDDRVEVIFTAKDNISGIEEITYKFIPNTEVSEEFLSELEGKLTYQHFILDGNGGKAAVKARIWLPKETLNEKNQLNGYFEFVATNHAMGATEYKDDIRIVADNIKPVLKVNFPENQVRDSVYYFKDSAWCNMEITEANFFASDVHVTVNEKEVSIQEDDWLSQNGKYVYTLPLAGEGDYTVGMEYTDRSLNEMDSYQSPKLVVDLTNPVIYAEVSSSGAVSEYGGMKYYSSNQTLVVTVNEHNFDYNGVRVSISAVGIDGRTIVSEEITSFSWNQSGDDTYTANISLTTDGIYSVSAACTDLSGRSASYTSGRFAIDKTAPTGLTIGYASPVLETTMAGETYNFYNTPVTVTVAAEDDISGIEAFEYRLIRADNVSDVNMQMETVRVSEGQIQVSENGGASYTFTLPGTTLNANGQLNGTLEVTAINRSMLSSTVKGDRRIIVDNLSPVMNVDYNDHVNEVDGTWYFDTGISASITIEEANYIKEDISFRVVKNGREDTPSIAWADRPNDRHFGSFELTEDGRYEVSLNYSDRSGNTAPDYKSHLMVVDTVAPQISIVGVSNEMASKAETIGFVVTISDENLVTDQVSVSLQAEMVDKNGVTNRSDLSKEGVWETSQDGKTITYRIDNLEKDAVYTLSCSAKDKANNLTDTVRAENGIDYEKIVFSVNRNGSTYRLSKETEALVGRFVQNPVDIVVEEINPNRLHNIKVTLFKNDKTIVLKEGTDYTLERVGDIDTWYRYVYTIDRSMFSEDGIYRISIYSEDAAGNVSNNALDNKNVEISFGIDRTSPNIIITNLEDGVTYPVNSLMVQIQASDNLKLVKGVAYLDGKEYASWDEQRIAEMMAKGESFTFEITDESTKAHELKVVMTDAAGNQTEKVVSGFFITTNLWIRYVNNKPLVIASIASLIFVTGGTSLLVVKRKRKLRR